MSIRPTISTLPDTRQTFSDITNYTFISGLFITQKVNLFSSIDDINDDGFWQNLLDTDVITPIHSVKEIDDLSEETFYGESKQDFTYEQRPGKNRKKYRSIWTIEKHELVSQYSGSDFYIVEYDRNNNVYLKEESGNYRGLKTTRINLEKFLYGTESTPLFSPLDIEYSETANFVHNVGFRLEDIDRLFMSLKVEAIGTNFLNFTATRGTEQVTSITATDVSVIDDLNGTLTFDVFNLNAGVYRLSGFSDTLTTGCLIVISSMYLGRTKYTATSIIQVSNNGLFDGLGNNIIFDGEGNNLIFDN
jgi:hypothetical protein